MHEISIVTSILSIIHDEMSKHNVCKLFQVNLCYGELTNVVPDSLYFAFEILTKGTSFDGACLKLEKIPLTLKCLHCLEVITPNNDKEAYFLPCPFCEQQKGYEVKTGRELYIKYIDAK